MHREQHTPILFGDQLGNQHLRWLYTILSKWQLRGVHQLINTELC